MRLVDWAEPACNESLRGNQFSITGPHHTRRPDTLKKIAHELAESLRKNLTVDWSARESVQARLRLTVKRILRKYRYRRISRTQPLSWSSSRRARWVKCGRSNDCSPCPPATRRQSASTIFVLRVSRALARRRMYDHNQTLVPDSFLALHSAAGRPLLSREATEARHELCEDVALHTAADLADRGHRPDDADDALRRCHAGLLAEPGSFSAAEAAWVIRRVAELQEWPQPAWLDEGSPAARP